MMRQCYPDADTAKMERHIFRYYFVGNHDLLFKFTDFIFLVCRMYDANRDGDIDFRWVKNNVGTNLSSKKIWEKSVRQFY